MSVTSTNSNSIVVVVDLTFDICNLKKIVLMFSVHEFIL